MKMIGNSKSFQELFRKQIEYQQEVNKLESDTKDDLVLPQDLTLKFQYHMTAMTEELGEVLKADKRWKTHRNQRYVPSEKLDELADVFITAMNLVIFSGFSAEELLSEVDKKILENIGRLEQERDVDSNN